MSPSRVSANAGKKHKSSASGVDDNAGNEHASKAQKVTAGQDAFRKPSSDTRQRWRTRAGNEKARRATPEKYRGWQKALLQAKQRQSKFLSTTKKGGRCKAAVAKRRKVQVDKFIELLRLYEAHHAPAETAESVAAADTYLDSEGSPAATDDEGSSSFTESKSDDSNDSSDDDNENKPNFSSPVQVKDKAGAQPRPQRAEQASASSAAALMQNKDGLKLAKLHAASACSKTMPSPLLIQPSPATNAKPKTSVGDSGYTIPPMQSAPHEPPIHPQRLLNFSSAAPSLSNERVQGELIGSDRHYWQGETVYIHKWGLARVMGRRGIRHKQLQRETNTKVKFFLTA